MASKSSPARNRILETAHDLFYRDGVRATGIDRLIAEAGVTKVTFYRHFPSKDDLVLAFLDYRHERWMGWFCAALARHREGQREDERRADPLAPLALALAEWFENPDFRGCAFINSVAEMGGALPRAVEIAARHKDDMTKAIAALLPRDMENRAIAAQAAGLAADGAIIRAQTGRAAGRKALKALRLVSKALGAR